MVSGSEKNDHLLRDRFKLYDLVKESLLYIFIYIFLDGTLCQ